MSFRIFRRVSRKSQRWRTGRRSRRRRIHGVELLEPRLTLDGFGVVGFAPEPVAGENPSGLLLNSLGSLTGSQATVGRHRSRQTLRWAISTATAGWIWPSRWSTETSFRC